MSDDDLVTLSGVTVEAETDKALLCVIHGEKHWIAKSQIHDNSEVYEKGTEGDLVISRWLAEKKGID